MKTRLLMEPFYSLTNALVQWRLDSRIKQMDSDKDEGSILGFVKGLRLSAQIAYIVRDIVSGHNLEVSWGHLLNDSGESCSPECDVIIHRPGFVHRWNGGAQPIMDFKFIECSKALAVISCKSKTNSVDKEYCKSFAKYNLENIFLFVECCKSHRVEPLKEQALASGYKGFFYLYTLRSEDFGFDQDPEVYLEFVKAMKGLAEA